MAAAAAHCRDQRRWVHWSWWNGVVSAARGQQRCDVPSGHLQRGPPCTVHGDTSMLHCQPCEKLSITEVAARDGLPPPPGPVSAASVEAPAAAPEPKVPSEDMVAAEVPAPEASEEGGLTMGEEVSSTTTYQVTSAFAGQSGGEFLRKESFYMDAEDYYDASSRRGSMTSCTMAPKKGGGGWGWGAGCKSPDAKHDRVWGRAHCLRPALRSSVLLPMGWGARRIGHGVLGVDESAGAALAPRFDLSTCVGVLALCLDHTPASAPLTLTPLGAPLIQAHTLPPLADVSGDESTYSSPRMGFASEAGSPLVRLGTDGPGGAIPTVHEGEVLPDVLARPSVSIGSRIQEDGLQVGGAGGERPGCMPGTACMYNPAEPHPLLCERRSWRAGTARGKTWC